MLICFENNIIGYNMILFKYIMSSAYNKLYVNIIICKIITVIRLNVFQI